MVGAIVAAAGSGSRLGRGSKALVRLNGRTTLARALELFLGLDEVDRIVVVGPPARLETAEQEVAALRPTKSVTVRGTVVKFNGGIMDRNWLHIQDGSGTSDAHNDDLTVTTDVSAKVGDVVTLSGSLGTNRDFGAGYAYDAILEKAVISAK